MTQFVTLDLSKDNEAFFPLRTVRTDKEYLNVPNKAFPAELKLQLSALYFAIAGKELDPEGNTIVAQYQDGSLKRIWGPAFYLSETSETFVLRWGKEVFPAEQEGETFFVGDAEFELGDIDNGKYTDIGLQTVIEYDDVMLTAGFVLKKAKYDQELKAKAVLKLIKAKGLAGVAELFRKTGEQASSSGETVYATKDLPPGKYCIKDWKGVKNNTRYIWSTEDASLAEGQEVTKLWAPSKLIAAINAGLQKGATISVVQLDGDKTRYDIEGEYILPENSLNLDWV